MYIIHIIDWGSDDICSSISISKESHDVKYYCHSMRYLRIFIRSLFTIYDHALPCLSYRNNWP